MNWNQTDASETIGHVWNVVDTLEYCALATAGDTLESVIADYAAQAADPSTPRLCALYERMDGNVVPTQLGVLQFRMPAGELVMGES